MNIYEIAARSKFRFLSNKGLLMTEQLFDLPLSSKSGCDLDNVARAVNTELKAVSEESFVDATPNARKTELTTMLEIVKAVIASKQEDAAAAQKRHTKTIEKRKLLDAISMKQEQQLTEGSLEELMRKLEALDEA